MNLGRLHVLVVHFPIAMAIGAALADVLWLATRASFFKHAGLYCLAFAALFTFPTIVTGLLLAQSEEFVGAYLAILTAHQWWGIASCVIASAAAAVRLLRRERLRGWWLGTYCLLMVGLVVAIGATGHYGGMLVHGKDFLSSLF